MDVLGYRAGCPLLRCRGSLWRIRQRISMNSVAYLYWQWLRRDLSGRYRGSMLGLAWPVLQPLSQILVFTLVFYEFMHLRWPVVAGSSNALDYGLNVFAGMAAFNFFAEILGRSPGTILAQPNLVTKVRFPLLVLPAVTVGAAAVHLVVGGVLISLAMLAFRQASPVIVLLPAFFLPMLLYGLGLAWILACLGVYLRDIGQVMPPLTSLLMFLTPIFYPASMIPAPLAFLVDFSPVAWSVDVFREMVILGRLPSLRLYFAHLLLSFAVALLAKMAFTRLSKGFADVL